MGVGIVGMGNMGSAIAKRLSSLGVVGFDSNPEIAEQVSRLDGIQCASSAEDVATRVDMLLLSLPSPQASVLVVQEVLPLLRPGSLVVETGTVTPRDSRHLEKLCGEAKVRFLEAAILSGVAAVNEGRATLLVGGSQEDFNDAGDVLDLLGQSQLAGPVGAGMSLKVANNAVAHAVMIVLIEAACLASATGADVQVLGELLRNEDAGLMRPLTHRLMDRVLAGHFEGGMPTEAARKDSMLALSIGQEYGVPLFALSACHTVYEAAVGAGLGREDYSSVARLWESWGHSLSDYSR